ncbi:MAG: hypothetical protein JWP91_1516 [Fibrobacteres bacterium]|nr:hypothetical protein [Fibrobacterota bacterium]
MADTGKTPAWNAMSAAQAAFDAPAEELARSKKAEKSQMFGKPCMKYRGNGFMAISDGNLALKLSGQTREDALKLEGSHLWDPSGQGRPMNEWVRIPSFHSSKWPGLAGKALEYNSTLPPK